MSLVECFDNIIGLSKTTCNCFPDPPAGYNSSLSPYFVDDAKYGVRLDMLAGNACESGGIWDKLKAARLDGINTFITHYLMALKHYTKPGRKDWSGDIGGKFNTALPITGEYAGLLIEPHQIKGGVLTIDCIALAMSCTGFFDVEVFDISDCLGSIADLEPLATIPVEAQASRKVLVNLDVPLRLDMTDSKGRCKKYLIAYKSNGCNPLNVEFHCGCGGAKPGYYSFLTPSGVSGSDAGNICAGAKDHKHTNGLCVGISFTCNSIGFLCKSWNYECDPFARTMSQTVQLFSIQCLIEAILTSGKMDAAIQCDFETLVAARDNLEANATDNINWLAQNVPEGATDCIECLTVRGLKKSGIYV